MGRLTLRHSTKWRNRRCFPFQALERFVPPQRPSHYRGIQENVESVIKLFGLSVTVRTSISETQSGCIKDWTAPSLWMRMMLDIFVWRICWIHPTPPKTSGGYATAKAKTGLPEQKVHYSNDKRKTQNKNSYPLMHRVTTILKAPSKIMQSNATSATR